MAPKKKSNKKQSDDWEDELGETAGSASTPAQLVSPEETTAYGHGADEQGSGGGGLLATLKKSKNKKAKKGKPVEDFVDGEDVPSTNGLTSSAAKESEEATLEDDDAFAGNLGKKGDRGKQQPDTLPVEDGEDEGAEGGRMKSKKEKEKEKKEREKQRKKEQVRTRFLDSHHWRF